jgi:hypothetical protein
MDRENAALVIRRRADGYFGLHMWRRELSRVAVASRQRRGGDGACMKNAGARHRWCRVRVHCYICTRCGCGRVNEEAKGRWIVTFHAPDGRAIVGGPTPPCRSGRHTAAYLAKYESAIAVGGLPKAPRDEALI